MSAPTLSVVVPLYRSESTVGALVERLVAVLGARAAAYEIILVNDGSPDRCWELVGALARTHSGVRGIDLMRNYGQHNALLCGIRAARHDVVITLDADLQHPPEEIPKLLDLLGQGYDLVYGAPREERHGIFRDLTSRLVKRTMRHVMGVRDAPQGSAFRAFHTRLREAFAGYQNPFVAIDVLLSWGARRLGAVEVRHEPRPDGRSSYSLTKLLTHCLNTITGFSTMPLRLVSWIGFFFTLFGIGVLVFVVGSYLHYGYSFPGFPFLASTIAIFAGAQLFALGIIGEYLARMHFRLMERPAYIVREQVGGVEESLVIGH